MINFFSGLFRSLWWMNTVIFLIGYSAWYIPPHDFWVAQPVAVLLPAIGVFATFSLVILVETKKWYLAGVTIVICLLFGFRFFQVYASPKDKSGPTRVTILSHNTGSVGSTPLWNSSLLADVLLHPPDFVLLQEVTAEYHENPQGVSFSGPLGQFIRESYSIRNFDSRSQHRTSLPTMSTSDTAPEVHKKEFSENDRGQIFFSRNVISIDGKSIAVYNVHLSSFRPLSFRENLHIWDLGFWTILFKQLKNDYVTRGSQAALLTSILAKENLPFIIGGDFNATVNNWSYRLLAMRTRDSAGRVGTGWTGTFPSRFPFLRIDFVLGSAGIRFHSSRVGARTPSDHRPIWASFYF